MVWDAGYGYKGAVAFGKNDTKVMRLVTWTNSVNTDSGSRVEALKWPDSTTTSAGGSVGDAWHHYAWTFDNGVFTAYLDGTNFANKTSIPNHVGTRTYSGLAELTVDSNGWLAIGCKTHFTAPSPYETPEFGDDSYPNHGWMNGDMDDIRIYNRALTPAEILTVYQGGQVGPAPDPDPGPDPEPSTSRAGATTLNVGTITAD